MAYLIRIIDTVHRGTWLLTRDGTLTEVDDCAIGELRVTDELRQAVGAAAAGDDPDDEVPEAVRRAVRRAWTAGYHVDAGYARADNSYLARLLAAGVEVPDEDDGPADIVLRADDPLPPDVRIEIDAIEGPWDAEGTWSHLTDWLHDETIVRPELTDDEVEALAERCQAEELVHGVWLDVEIVARQIRQVRDDRRRELLDAAVEATGLSRRVFAEERMVRDERTIRRWTSGEIPIPDVAVAALRRIVAAE